MKDDVTTRRDKCRQVLGTAADLIAQHGGTVGANPEGRPLSGARGRGVGCTIFAVSTATVKTFGFVYGEPWPEDARKTWLDAMDQIKKTIASQSIGQWNDDPERTADEVVRTLRTAAGHDSSG